MLTRELKLPSHSHIICDNDAVIFAGDGCFTGEGKRAVVTNSDYQGGNEDITVEGGVWDGNNKNNPRGSWMDGPNMGLLFSFFNVKGLTLKNVVMRNSESYHFRAGFVTDFLLEDILIEDDFFTICQDGLHIGGGCHRGVIRNLRAAKGSTNDDLVAFNADDANWYCHNRGMKDAPISDMLVENVYAEDCWTGVRLLSVKSEISNVTVRNFTAGVREMGINLDATRYAAHRIYNADDYPHGVGNLKNIRFENVTFWRTNAKKQLPLIVAETNAENFVITNFKRRKDLEDSRFENKFTMRIRNLARCCVSLNGEEKELAENEELCCEDDVSALTINRL